LDDNNLPTPEGCAEAPWSSTCKPPPTLTTAPPRHHLTRPDEQNTIVFCTDQHFRHLQLAVLPTLYQLLYHPKDRLARNHTSAQIQPSESHHGPNLCVQSGRYTCQPAHCETRYTLLPVARLYHCAVRRTIFHCPAINMFSGSVSTSPCNSITFFVGLQSVCRL
jgi:hypothetical protein